MKKAFMVIKEEWDFSNLLPDEIDICLFYEYSRESARARELVKSFRKEFPPFTFSEENNESEQRFWKWWAQHCGWFTRKILVLFTASEWPDTPWQLLKQARKDYLRKIYSRKIPSVNLQPISEESFRGLNFLFHPSENCFHAVVDWTKPDTKLIQEFKQQLKNHRPSSHKIPRSKKASYKTDLRFLGAMRLLQKNKAEEAIEHTQQIGKKPLFSEASGWSKAKKKAKDIFQNQFHFDLPVAPSLAASGKFNADVIETAHKTLGIPLSQEIPISYR